MAALQRLALRGTPKATKAAARYTPAGGAERCGMCRHYVPSSSCARIEGPVSAAGWCQLYSQQVTWRPRAGQDAGLNPGLVPPGVTLDLDFMVGTLDPRITFTRASTATYFDATGTMQTAAVNVPRWDYDPVTHIQRGLLIEDARTNVLLNSATLGTQSVTVTAQAYTLSFYGTGTVTKSGTASGALVGTGAAQRVSQTFTPTAGTLTLTVTGSAQNAQLEAGAFASSFVATAAAAVTRAVDVASMPTAAWFNGSTMSVVMEATILGLGGGSFNTLYALDDGTSNNRLHQLMNGSIHAASIVESAGVFGVALPETNNIALGAIFKFGATLQSGAFTSSFNGGGFYSSTSGVVLPVAMNTLWIGNETAGLPLNGYVRRVRYWPRVLSAAELQSVTT